MHTMGFIHNIIKKVFMLMGINSVPLGTIRAYARLSFRWMDAYRHGLKGRTAEYAVKNHKAHRTINEEIMNRINVLLN
jgi:hypothetical protein